MSVMTRLPELRCECLEAVSSERHELGYSLQVPVGVAEIDVADVGRERQHCIVDVCTFRLPEHQPSADKSVPQIVDTDELMAPARHDADVCRQSEPRAAHGPVAQSLAAALVEEERRGMVGRAEPRSRAQVISQSRCRGRVQRYHACPLELGVLHRDPGCSLIETATPETQRLGDAQTRRGKQAKERREHGRAGTEHTRKSTRG